MPKGGEIFISTSHDNGYVIIQISDTGGGIPGEIISGVFEYPFLHDKRGSASATGLGLAILANWLFMA